jgi:hypothetical protein
MKISPRFIPVHVENSTSTFRAARVTGMNVPLQKNLVTPVAAEQRMSPKGPSTGVVMDPAAGKFHSFF